MSYLSGCIKVFLPSVFFILFSFNSAEAYVDPVTGNALVYLLFASFGAVLYFFQSFFYRAKQKSGKNKNEIVFFSEGAMYWDTFKPVVDELLKREQSFVFLTMDLLDPVLLINNPFCKARYIGKGNRAYATLGNIEADILVSTTPNIGSVGFPVRRSLKVEKLVHLCHSLITDIEWYRKHSLDFYDIVLLGDRYMKDPIRLLENKRNLPAKKFFEVGVPYADVLTEKLEQKQKEKPQEKSTEYIKQKQLLIAPSWGEKSVILRHPEVLTSILKRFSEEGFKVVLRLHPQTVKNEKELVGMLKKRTSSLSGLSWDEEVNPFDSLYNSDLLITDVSIIRADFAFIFKKPVITLFDEKSISVEEWEFHDLKDSNHVFLSERIDEEIGERIYFFDLDKILQRTKSLIRTIPRFEKTISKIKDTYLINVGRAGSASADVLQSILKEDKNKIKIEDENKKEW